MSERRTFHVTTRNQFHNGWYAWLLGLPRPDGDPLEAEGWDFADGQDSIPLKAVRAASQSGYVWVEA